MAKIKLDEYDIEILVKKSRWWFWIGLIVLAGPVIGCIYSLIEELMDESINGIYCIMLLAVLVPSFILLLILVLKTAPGLVRRKYQNGYKIVEELSIQTAMDSAHGGDKYERRSDNPDHSVSDSGYTLYHMRLSNGKKYEIEYSEYKAVKEGRASYAELQTAEKTGKLISVRVIRK